MSLGSAFGALGGLVSSGIGAIGSLVQGNKQNKTQQRIARETNEANLQIARENNMANMELAKWTNEQNLNFWNMQNEYNTPANQMARLEDAGLNPNLMYGQGNTGNASSAPSSSSPHFDAPRMQGYNYQVPDVIGAFQQFANLVMSLTTASKQQNLLDAQADYTNARAYNELNGRRDLLELDRLFRGSTLTGRVDYENNKWRLQESNIDLSKMRLRQLDQLINFNNEMNPLRRDYLDAGIRLRKGQLSLQEHENIIKAMHAKLWNQGINPNDSLLMRQLGVTLEPLILPLQKMMNGLADKMAKYF